MTLNILFVDVKYLHNKQRIYTQKVFISLSSLYYILQKMSSPIWTNYETLLKFINNGMDLNQRDPLKNGTILHYWAGIPGHRNSNQGDSLAVVKLLIEKGANLLAVNSWRFTPLLEAANGRDGECPNLVVLDFLLERDEYSQEEKIEAMELAGAVILGNVKNRLTHLFHKAFDYWRKALQLRQMNVEGSDPIQKTRLNLKTVRTTEWITSAELENVIEHPDTYVIQSFLVRLRIFYFKSLKAVESFFGFHIKNFCFLYLRFLNGGDNNKTFDIIWAMLETLCQFDTFEEYGLLQCLTKKLIEKIILVFSCSPMDSPDFLTEEITKSSLELILLAIILHRIDMYQVIDLVMIFFNLPQILKEGPLRTLSEVRDHCGQNLLHFVCKNSGWYYGNLYDTIRLLLNVGCDPNAIDQDGNTPLHHLAQLDEQLLFSYDLFVVRLLLDFGAQLSLKNLEGKTAIDLWIRKHEKKLPRSGKLIDWCSELPTLTSLCARVIRGNRIPYSALPGTLIKMIEEHKIDYFMLELS